MKKRFFQRGITMGYLHSGSRNSIADVGAVTVGHATRVEGDDIRTGVTIIDPGIENIFRNKIPAAVYVGNGFGKIVGTTQIEELGTLETPIALTNTLAVGPVMRAMVDVVASSTPELQPYETINAVVGETNDGILNAIHKNVIDSSDVKKAYETCSKDFAIGNVGAGTGTRAFSWKGGIGTSSRQFVISGISYTLGVLVQTNFGGSLTIAGVPVGKFLKKDDFGEIAPKRPDGSCMIVLATDAPVDSRQLKRIAKRASFGLVRTGSIAAHGSGDYVIAFSTDRDTSRLADADLNSPFLAAVEATEEAIYDAIFSAETLSGRDGNILEALPVDQVIDLIQKTSKFAP